MSYTPPSGNSLTFVFDDTYEIPNGNALTLYFDVSTTGVFAVGEASIELSGEASGYVAYCGDGAAEITLSGEGGGFVAVFGSGSATLALDALGAGEAFSYQDVVGDGAGVIELVGTGEGGIHVSGAADSSIGLTASADGVRGTGGTAAGVIQLTADGVGEALAGTEAKCAALLHYEGTAGVQGPFVDETGKVWTVSGAPVFTTNHVTGDTGIQLSVAGPDYLTTPFHQDFNFGPNDFAIQSWVRPGAKYDSQSIVANTNLDADALGRWRVGIYSGAGFPASASAFFCSTSGLTYSLGSGPVIGFQQDHFISVQRKGLTLTLEVDGVVLDTETIADPSLSFGAESCPILIGTGGGLHYHGTLDETRILNGVAPDTTLAEAQSGFTLQSDIPVTSVSGDGVGVIALTGDGSGETTMIVSGDGLGVIALTGVGSGTVSETTDVFGTGAATILFASGDGAIGCAGTASASLSLTGDGEGAIPALSWGEGTIALSGSGVGIIGYSGTAAASIELSGSGSGVFYASVSGAGVASIQLSWSGLGETPMADLHDTFFVRTKSHNMAVLR